jgi:hypothetical protein
MKNNKSNIKEDYNKDADERCAPSKKFNKGSCFTTEALIKIANNYNNKYTDKINTSLPRDELIIVLENKLKNVCSEQTCWLRLNIVKELKSDDIENHTFRPEGPNKQYDWLSTNHIDDVMEQYQKIKPSFIFLGTVPYDFEQIKLLGIYNLNLSDLEKQGKTEIGMVINLDEHWQTGSHWVGLYINLEKYQIYYYDSVGNKPGKRVRAFISKVTKFLYYKKFKEYIKIGDIVNKLKRFNNNINDKYVNNIIKGGFDINYNKNKHQLDNSECGVYSIYFIERMINGESFNDVTNNIITDDVINQRRKIYFRNVNF